MPTSLIGAHADYRPNDFHFARTQREAGIEHLEWEGRLPAPLSSNMLCLAITLCWLVFMGALVWKIAN